jgi:dihydrofolate synthase/folylpolyglutamate synthase
MDYKESILRIFELQKFGIKLGLASMRGILGRLGDPHQGGRFVHVAGTNGKGSTLAFLEAALGRAGYKVGLYSSPHLVTFRERIRLAGELVSEAGVMGLSEEVWGAVDPSRPPTFFEFVTAMAFLHFQRGGADIALMETGMGGRLDSTNVLDPLVSAVTNVGLDHTAFLGPTLGAIAAEKAGVVKAGRPFLAGRLGPEALGVIDRRAAELGVAARVLGRDFEASASADAFPELSFKGESWDLRGVRLGLMGAHQADNAALALAILEALSGLGYAIPQGAVREGLASPAWPGRAELFPPGSWPPGGGSRAALLLDGDHNPDGARALAGLLARRPERAIHLVAWVMADKDLGGILGPLAGLAGGIYLTRPDCPRAADPGALLLGLGPDPLAKGRLKGLFPRLPDALSAAASEAREGELVVVAGSLFAVGEARAWLKGQGPPESN